MEYLYIKGLFFNRIVRFYLCIHLVFFTKKIKTYSNYVKIRVKYIIDKLNVKGVASRLNF